MNDSDISRLRQSDIVNRNIKTFEIPLNITNIGYGTFFQCAYLEELIIPKNVISIGGDAFTGCISLKKLNILNLNCIINTAFSDTLYEKIYRKFRFGEVYKHSKSSVSSREYANKKFIEFLNLINEDKNNIIKYISNGLLTFEDIIFLLDEGEYKGLKQGINYGI